MTVLVLLAVTIAGFLSACTPVGTTFFYLDQKAPSQFSPEELAGFESLQTVGGNSVCLAVENKVAAYTAADRKVVAPLLRSRGLSARDVDLIPDPTASYGTGMSWFGLTCVANGEPEVNRSFYPGVGNQWQAMVGSGYVYLRGDGTPAGMKVYAWN